MELQATSANAVITIAGASGTDLDVTAGSTLTLGGSAYTIKLALSTGATGAIAGNVTFSGSSSGTGLNHQMTSPDVAGITFASGSVMTGGANFTGYPFGTTPNGAVIFSTGSSYIHASGSSPFGGVNAINVATFNTGCLYKYTGTEGTVGTVVTAKPLVAAKTYGNYEVNTTASISNSNPAGNFSYENITVNGTSFAISGNTSGATATIKGNVSIGTAGGITFGLASAVSPVIFGGTSPQTVSLSGTGFFTIGAGSVMSVNNDLTLNGDVTLSGTVNVATTKTLSIASGKSLTLGSTAVLNVAAGATLNNAGVLLNFATLANSGTFTNTGFLVNASSNDNAMGTVSGSVAGDVSLLATPKSGYHFVNWTESSTPVSTTTSYVFTASANRTLVANFASNTVSVNTTVNASTLGLVPVSQVTVSSSGVLTIDGITEINSLTIQNGGQVTNNSDITVTNFTINSNVSGTGTYVDNGTTTVKTTTTVNQYLTTGRNWYISNPVATVSPTFASGTITFNKYDETVVTDAAGATGWSVTTDPLEAKKGYIATVSVDGNVTFSGALNDGDQSISVSSRTGTANKAGFNLIGNPYPSYLDWTAVCAYTLDEGLTYPNLDKLRSSTLWYRTKKLNQASELVYQFWTVNGDGVSSPTGASAKIPPMQAFWVRANAGGGSLALTNTMRSLAPATDYLLKAPSAKNTANPLVRIQVSNGINTDEAVIYFSANASNGLDSYDSPKMFENKAEVPEIYTTVSSEKMVINGMKTIPLDTPIGLGFVAGNASSFSIMANEIRNLPTDIKVMLRDNVTLTETDLTDALTVYTFSPAVTSTDRFSIIFRTAGIVNAIENAKDNNILVYSNAHRQITVVNNKNINCVVSLYNAVGQKLVTKQMTGTCMQLDGVFTPGVYVVRVNNVIEKVIVN